DGRTGFRFLQGYWASGLRLLRRRSCALSLILPDPQLSQQSIVSPETHPVYPRVRRPWYGPWMAAAFSAWASTMAAASSTVSCRV
ncbi:MAG: hypothetical protein WA510_15815, partial [Acidobacteriaceae bacterium]